MYVARDVADPCLPIISLLPIATAGGMRGKLCWMEEEEGCVKGAASYESEGGGVTWRQAAGEAGGDDAVKCAVRGATEGCWRPVL